ncbi:hypothetical protein SGLAU_29055 [Streptomyces glaucescens]|uniref:Uncharacterized protein n=1 Tax=Streptomyces glaucescens TaxID=1907 RepID=A0A089XKL8_STRGA|nr:hypothetical protein SGLAU_29055 [Streptomyces glaucescens]
MPLSHGWPCDAWYGPEAQPPRATAPLTGALRNRSSRYRTAAPSPLPAALATDAEAAFVGITTGPYNMSTASAVSTASTAWKQP